MNKATKLKLRVKYMTMPLHPSIRKKVQERIEYGRADVVSAAKAWGYIVVGSTHNLEQRHKVEMRLLDTLKVLNVSEQIGVGDTEDSIAAYIEDYRRNEDAKLAPRRKPKRRSPA